MALVKQQKYKILIDPKSKKQQGLKVGDIVRRQYFDSPNLIYSLMTVIETGVDVIGGEDSAYFIGILLEGDEPRTGELLDFVRVTNLFDSDRSGALYLTASDSDAPFMDVIDGIASEKSLFYPTSLGFDKDTPSKDQYKAVGSTELNFTYSSSEHEASRVLRLTKLDGTSDSTVGIVQKLPYVPEHPGQLLISFKVRSSVNSSDNRLSFTLNDGEEVEAETTFDISDEWQFKFYIIRIEYPGRYSRTLDLSLNDSLKQTGDWCEIADFNIVELSSIANFSEGTKARVGKIKGIVDPVFGVLDGYGAYFQIIYATKNVNIAGTLTAGDENGFSSTFYVGKIHKNVIVNSIDCRTTGNFYTEDIVSPVGIGKVYGLIGIGGIIAQSSEWLQERTGKEYCLSFWAKSDEGTTLKILQNNELIGTVSIDSSDWKRYCISYPLNDKKKLELFYEFENTGTTLFLSAPQLEAGNKASQYQPTDGTLSYVEDYGAWFNKGGIGGTIQNPLLKLNENGSISSGDNSFVIKPDGTGYFSNGRFKWEKDKIILQDVTIKWEDFDDETKANMQAKYVSLEGTNVIRFPDALDEDLCEPKLINIFAKEVNFTATKRQWKYLDSYSEWKDLYNNKDFLSIVPNGHYWEGREILSILYTATYNTQEYSDIFTISKQYDGQSTYSVYINSNNGLVFKNGIIQTTLFAYVYKGGEDITKLIPDKNFIWKRISNDSASDAIWNSYGTVGKELTLTGNDIFHRAVFDCEVIISTK